MAEVEYYKLEQRDSLNGDKTRSVYRIKRGRTIPAEEFIKKVAHRRSFPAATITGVLMDVAAELIELLGQGESVEVPGIGVFSIGVRMKKVTQEEVLEVISDGEVERVQAVSSTEPNARRLELHHINYRKNNDLFKEVGMRFHQQEKKRTMGRQGVRIRRSKYPQVKNRMYVAREFLQTHPFMTIQNYADLTGLSYSTAQRELRANWNNSDYGIDIEGLGSHRVYVLRKEK